jgi:hypothetical protein
MSVYAHFTGQILRAPSERKSSAGNRYAFVLLLVGTGTTGQLVNCNVFEPFVDGVLQLRQGESLSVTGTLTVSVYEKNGEHRPSLSLMVSAILSGRKQVRQGRTTGTARPGISSKRTTSASRNDPFPDEWGRLDEVGA